MHTLSLLAALGLAAQQAVATYDFVGAPSYNTPGSKKDECNDDQKSGLDFGKLPTGSFQQYAGMNFKGFECSNTPPGSGKGKRGLIKRTQFQNKCVKGNTKDKPSISCDKDFSIKQYQVTTDKKAELQFTYDMGHGQTCQHKGTCGPEGTTIDNHYCGGAKSVTVHKPEGDHVE